MNGDTLSGEIISRSAKEIVLLHPSLGEIVIPVASVQPDEPPNPGVLGSDFLAGWERRFELGFSGSDGNSKSTNVRAGVLLGFEDARRRSKFSVDYFFDRSDGETEDHNARARYERDWLRPGSKLFYFANAQYDWDDFEAWEHRVSAFSGLGYDLMKRENNDLRARLGLGVTKEFGDEEDDWMAEVLLGLENEWRISKLQTMLVSSVFYPDLLDFGEYRNVSKAEWISKLGSDSKLSVKLGIENEYESDAPKDSEQNDFQYYGSLIVEF